VCSFATFTYTDEVAGLLSYAVSVLNIYIFYSSTISVTFHMGIIFTLHLFFVSAVLYCTECIPFIQSPSSLWDYPLHVFSLREVM
jgi:hypothetical protein